MTYLTALFQFSRLKFGPELLRSFHVGKFKAMEREFIANGSQLSHNGFHWNDWNYWCATKIKLIHIHFIPTPRHRRYATCGTVDAVKLFIEEWQIDITPNSAIFVSHTLLSTKSEIDTETDGEKTNFQTMWSRPFEKKRKTIHFLKVRYKLVLSREGTS